MTQNIAYESYNIAFRSQNTAYLVLSLDKWLIGLETYLTCFIK